MNSRSWYPLFLGSVVVIKYGAQISSRHGCLVKLWHGYVVSSCWIRRIECVSRILHSCLNFGVRLSAVKDLYDLEDFGTRPPRKLKGNLNDCRLRIGIMEMEPDIENMTLTEYLEYEAVKERRLWDNVQSKSSPTRVGAENMRRMGQEKIQNGCNVDTSRDMNHESGNLLNFPIFSATNEFSSIYEQDFDLKKEEVEVEDDDYGDTYDIWDIIVEDAERIRQFLMPNIPDVIDEVIQPLIPQPIQTTPPNDDYVAPATTSILDELLEEFRDEIVNVAMVKEEADSNPTRDIGGIERLLTKDP
ncbi:hypothetical protein Tco_1401400 [Tanacetum coccineum]